MGEGDKQFLIIRIEVTGKEITRNQFNKKKNKRHVSPSQNIVRGICYIVLVRLKRVKKGKIWIILLPTDFRIDFAWNATPRPARATIHLLCKIVEAKY